MQTRCLLTGTKGIPAMHSLWTRSKQIISGASLAEVKSTAYEGLIVKTLLNDLAIVSS